MKTICKTIEECFVIIVDMDRLSLDFRGTYMDFWHRCDDFSSDYSFIILYAWDETLNYHTAISDDLVWIKQEHPETVWLAPVGNWRRGDWKDILLRNIGEEGVFWAVPQGLAAVWGEALGACVRIEEDRDAFEYLYNVSDLATLKGNKYMRKRNRVNHFSKEHPYTYRPIDGELLPQVLQLQLQWCSGHDCCSDYLLRGEHLGITKVLHNWDGLPGIMGGVIETAGHLVAYTVAEAINDSTVMIHFEKGHPDYPQAYQVINRDFLANSAGEFSIVNREEDMGNEGLRESKLSYLPTGFLKKYKVTWRADGNFNQEEHIL